MPSTHLSLRWVGLLFISEMIALCRRTPHRSQAITRGNILYQCSGMDYLSILPCAPPSTAHVSTQTLTQLLYMIFTTLKLQTGPKTTRQFHVKVRKLSIVQNDFTNVKAYNHFTHVSLTAWLELVWSDQRAGRQQTCVTIEKKQYWMFYSVGAPATGRVCQVHSEHLRAPSAGCTDNW